MVSSREIPVVDFKGLIYDKKGFIIHNTNIVHAKDNYNTGHKELRNDAASMLLVTDEIMNYVRSHIQLIEKLLFLSLLSVISGDHMLTYIIHT